MRAEQQWQTRRIDNDLATLKRCASERMQVHIKRFGTKVIAATITFPSVKTAFLNVTKNVEVGETLVEGEIIFQASSIFSYPLGPPLIRIAMPKLKKNFVPWLSGLLWLDRKQTDDSPDDIEFHLSQQIRALMPDTFLQPIGIPCLWRKNTWSMECNLVFVARQIHIMLTDPRDYSPTDAMNPIAAEYWATHKEQLPLEPPIPEIYTFRRASAHHTKNAFGFKLIEVT